MNVFNIKIYIRLCFCDNSLQLREFYNHTLQPFVFLRSQYTATCVFEVEI